MTDKIYDPFDDITELVMLDDEKLEKIYQAILKGCVYKVANDIYYLDRESKIEYIINDIAANEIDDYIKEKLLSLQKKMPEIVQDENIETKKNYTIELDHYVQILCNWKISHPKIIDKCAYENKKFFNQFNQQSDLKHIFYFNLSMGLNPYIETESRAIKYIMDFLLQYKNVDIPSFINMGLFSIYSFDELLDLQKRNILSDEDIRNILIDKEKSQKPLEPNEKPLTPFQKLALQYQKQMTENSKFRKPFLRLFPIPIFLILYRKSLDNPDNIFFTEEDFRANKKNITEREVARTDCETLVYLKNQLNDKINSKLIMENYLENFSGSDIIILAENGIIPEEKVIDMLAISNATIYDETKMISKEELLQFYHGERLLKLLQNNKINQKFIQVFHNRLMTQLTEEEKKQYYQEIGEQIRKISNAEEERFENYLQLYHATFLPSYVMETGDFESERYKQAYIDERLSREQIDALYLDGVINENVIEDIYTDEEKSNLFQKMLLWYRNDKQSDSQETIQEKQKKLYHSALTLIPDYDERMLYLFGALENQKIMSEDVLNCFLADIIDIEQFKEIIFAGEQQENLSDFLEEGTDIQKIKQLFLNYMIDYDELLTLQNKHILTQEQFDKINTSLRKADFFSDLKKTKSIFVAPPTLFEKKESKVQFRNDGRESNDESKKAKKGISNFLKYNFLEELDASSFTPIEGTGTSLDGYTVVGFEKYGLVILENFEKVNNATYIMPWQQYMFYMKNPTKAKQAFGNKENGKIFTGSKRILRENKTVKIHNHTSGWGKNIVDSIDKMNRENTDKLKQNGEYSENIALFIGMLEESYDQNR